MEVQQQILGGRYTLLDELGRGGMAVVWRARDEVLGRTVAVKVLAGRYAADPQSRARIRDEARAAAALSHPNIAQVYDFGESETSGWPETSGQPGRAGEAGRAGEQGETGERGKVGESGPNGGLVPYVVMELVPGGTLQQRMAAGKLEPAEVFRICGQVAAALAAAHADGLVHRDIKPGNVMVPPEGAKVVDFGLAAVAGPAEPGAEVFGTPAYLAPERLTGGAVEPASDVYALGVLLFRLLAGELPWTADSTTQMLTAHVYVAPAPLPALAGVPPQVTDLVNQCLGKDPAERPSAAQAAAVLTRAADTAPPPLIAVPSPQRTSRRLLLGGVAAAVLAAVLLWLILPIGAEGDTDAATPAASIDASGRSVTGAAPGGSAAPPTRAGAILPAQPNRVSTPASGAAVPVLPSAGVTQPSAGTSEQPSPSPTPEPSTEPATANVQTFTSRGGTIEARCNPAGKAKLVDWTAQDPYEVHRVNDGPAVAAVIVFKDGASRIRMTVTCVAGIPTEVTVPL